MKRQRIANELKRAAQAKDAEKVKNSGVRDLDSSKREGLVKEADEMFYQRVKETREKMKGVLEEGEEGEEEEGGDKKSGEGKALDESERVEDEGEEGGEKGNYYFFFWGLKFFRSE